jgi:hypothetical protein
LQRNFFYVCWRVIALFTVKSPVDAGKSRVTGWMQRERAVDRMFCMGSNGKPNGRGADHLSATEIAKLAGISRQRVAIKLKQGKSAERIIREAETRRQRELLRNLPVVPVNGDGIASFAVEQTTRAHWSAKIQEVEYYKRTRELIPQKWVRNWAAHFLIQAKQTLQWAPSELRDELSMESDPIKCGQILERLVDRVLSHFHSMKVMFEEPPPDEAA